MAYLIGAGLAIAIGLMGTSVGFDRERGFYPTLLLVIAAYYILFAAIGGAGAMVPELAIAAIFAASAIWGFKRNLWVAVAGLFAHGLMDFVHGALVSNSGVPDFWPAFCGSYDVVAAAYLSWLLARNRPPTAAVPASTA